MLVFCLFILFLFLNGCCSFGSGLEVAVKETPVTVIEPTPTLPEGVIPLKDAVIAPPGPTAKPTIDPIYIDTTEPQDNPYKNIFDNY